MKKTFITLAAISFFGLIQATPLQDSIKQNTAAGTSLAPSVRNAYSQSALGLDVSQVLSQCRDDINSERLKEILTDSENLSPARKRAIGTLQQRCSQFTASEVSEQSERQARSNALQANDLQILLATRYGQGFSKLSTFDTTTRRDLLNQIFKLADPTLIDNLGARLFTYRVDNKNPIIYYNGKEYLLQADPEILYALPLVKCELGAYCGQNEYTVLQTCAYSGNCFKSLNELVADKVQAAGKDVSLVNQLAKAMGQSIRSNDVNSFIRR